MFESRTDLDYTSFRAKNSVKKEIGFTMRNQILLGMIVVINLLLPASVQSVLSEDTKTVQATGTSTEFPLASNVVEYLKTTLPDKIKTSADKPVTPAVSKQSENELEATHTPEEERIKTIKEWENNFPQIKEDSQQAQFINTIAPAAVLIANEHGIYPSVMIAQAGLESNWGRSDLAQSYNNLMGTKGSWEGESVTVQTREDVNGASIYIDAGFSVYDSWADSLHRYGLLMKTGLEWNPDYYSGTWIKNTESYQDATAWLEGRYATDSAYASKLNQTIQSYNLEQYDDQEAFDDNLEESLEQLVVTNK